MDDKKQIAAIDWYLEASNTGPSAFSRAATGDGAFLSQIKASERPRSPTGRLWSRVFSYIEGELQRRDTVKRLLVADANSLNPGALALLGFVAIGQDNRKPGAEAGE